MSVPEIVDHIVFAGPDLAEAVAQVRDLTGVEAASGGQHPTGTANALIAFTRNGERLRTYLEVIGPIPGLGSADAHSFDIARRTEPHVAQFAVHPDDLETAVAAGRSAGLDLADVAPLSRTTPDGTEIRWRLSPSADAPYRVPFLIDWGFAAHPGLDPAAPTLELLALRRITPDAEQELSELRALGIPATLGRDETGEPADAIEVVQGEVPGFELEVLTAAGSVILS